ncbi:MAG: hypothetical protein HOI70_04460 [Opitutae bacterium]|jgi:hypothetical protein|nr:hypothetical protein [Opitutae bacterium]
MSNQNHFYLACPYAEKDEAKSLGARWDNDARKWYVPAGVDREPFSRWVANEQEEAAEEHAPFFG